MSRAEVNVITDVLSVIESEVFLNSESSIVLVSADSELVVAWMASCVTKSHRVVERTSLFERYIAKREEHSVLAQRSLVRGEMVFHLLSLNINQSLKILIETDTSDQLWSAQLRRLGYQIISIGSASNDYDLRLSTIEGSEILREGRLYVAGLRSQVSANQAIMYSRYVGAHVKAGFGRAIRSRSMFHALANGRTYVGLGDRGESVEEGLASHVPAVHIGVFDNEVRQFKLPIIYERAESVPALSSQGQRKLRVVHEAMCMLLRPDKIVYLGGSPGSSLYNYLATYKVKCMIIDPAPIDPILKTVGVEHVQSIYQIGQGLPTPGPRAVLFNDVRGSRPKNGWLVLAPSGSGKSFYSKRGYWVDGDTLVKWPNRRPDGKKWWEVMPAKEQEVMGLKHLKQIEDYIIKNGRPVAFNPSFEAINKYDFSIPVIIWMPNRKEHLSNIEKRISEGNSTQPADIGLIDKNRDILEQFAKTRGYPIVTSVDKAQENFEWEREVENNFRLMESTILEAKRLGYSDYVGKLRIPKFWSTFPLPSKCMVWMQPWAGSNSLESRIWIDLKSWDGSWITGDVANYENCCRQWNWIRYHNPEVNQQQEKALYGMSVTQRDYVRNPVPDIKRFGLYYALFSTSNVMNGHKYWDLVGCADVTMYPNQFAAKCWTPGYLGIWYFRDYYTFDIIFGIRTIRLSKDKGRWVCGNKGKGGIIPVNVPGKMDPIRLFDLLVYSDGTWCTLDRDYGLSKCLYPLLTPHGDRSGPFIVQESLDGDAQYFDYTCDPSYPIPGYCWFNIRDYVVMMEYNSVGKRFSNVSKVGFDFTHPISNLWGAWVNKTSFALLTMMQTWINGQTSWSKVMTTGIRRGLGLRESEMHEWRRQTLIALFKNVSGCRCKSCVSMDYKVTILHHTKLTGILTYGKKNYVIATAGHMIGMLLAGGSGLVDLNRYLDTIEGNLIAYSDAKSQSRRLMRILGPKGLLAETNYKHWDHLWHSYWDWYTAVGTYLYMCRKLRLKVNLRGVLLVFQRLRILRKRFSKIYDDGWQAVESRITV